MSKFYWNLVKATPAIIGASFIVSQSALANPTSQIESNLQADTFIAQALPEEDFNFNSADQLDVDPMDQVTSVSELRDVQPTEWAYEALRSLVERYGCIVGYPDRTYRGDRALSRWEFAAGLNACMNVMERLIQENVSVLKEDVDKLKRLMQEFEAELAALGARVDNLEGRVSFLEEHQFSTTTKLKGEVIFSIGDTFGDFADGSDAIDSGDDTQVVFQNRVRLNLETSFTGEDLLKTRLQAGNFDGGNKFDVGNTGTNMTRLAYDDGAANNVTIDDLWYRFPIGEKITAWVGASGLDLDDVFSTNNPYLADSGTGSLSRLGRYNQFANRGPSGTGAAMKFQFSEKFYLTAAYLADKGDAPDPTEGSGLFNGSYSGGAQLGFLPSEKLELAFTYRHTYRTAGGPGLFGGVSSADAETPFGSGVATSADLFALSASYKIGEKFHIGAWGGYGFADAEGIDADQVDLWTWNANFSILDVGKEGAVLSLAGGLPPKGDVEDSSYIIQAQYKYPLTDNIYITPGAYVILNPNHDDDNDTVWVGVLRTTFKF